MPGTTRYQPSTDPQVTLVREFLMEQYGTALDLAMANWDADAKEIIRRVEHGRCRHKQQRGTVTQGLFVLTCADCDRVVERIPDVKAG